MPRKYKLSTYVAVVGFVLLGLWILFPLYYTVVTAFKARLEVTYWPPNLFPEDPSLEYWTIVWFDRPTVAYYTNTIIASTLSTVIALILGIPAAYACGRYTFKGRSDVLFTILTFRFLPPAAVIIPMYLFARGMGIVDSPVGLSLIYAAINLPIIVWVLRSYIIEIPPELEESYMIDGYSRLRAFFKVTLPLAKPGIIAISLLVLALSWGEFLIAAILTTSPMGKTLPVGVSEYMGGEWGYEWNKIASVTIYGLIPLILVFMIIRKHLARGLTFGIVR